MIREWIKVVKGISIPEEKRRAEICSLCPHRTKASFLEMVDSGIKEVRGHYCSNCGCPLVAKIKTQNKKHVCKLWNEHSARS